MESNLSRALNEVEIQTSLPGATLEFGVSWDFTPGQPVVDLDCSAVCFDFSGLVQDAVFFNNRRAASGALNHSGDSLKGEKEGFDETIVLDLSRLPPFISMIVFVINANTGGTFGSLESAYAELTEISAAGRTSLTSISIGCGSSSTGCVLALLHRKETTGSWVLRKLGRFCSGHTFGESMPAVRGAVDELIDPALRQERILSREKVFNLQKGDAVEIPQSLLTGSYDLYVGLGWTCQKSFDLDTSVVLSDGKGKKIDVVYFANREYLSAVRHCGDNRSGEGAGDDEKIEIDLDNIPAEVVEMTVVVNIYSTGGSFKDVTSAYIRLVASKDNKELCRYNLDGNTVHSNGLVFAQLARPAGTKTWLLRALGKECEGRVVTDDATMTACGISSTNSYSCSQPANNQPQSGNDGCCVVC